MEKSVTFPPNSEGAKLVVTSVKLGFAIYGLWLLTNVLFFASIICSIIGIVNFLLLHGAYVGFGIAGAVLFGVHWYTERVWANLRKTQEAVMKRLSTLAVEAQVS